jgi:hypothetical protein
MPETEPIVVVDLKRVQQRQQAVETVLIGVRNRNVGPEVLESLVRDVAAELRAPVDAVFESLRYLAGTTPTAQSVAQVSWRLAANTAQLRGGRAVPCWSGQRSDEWVAGLILDWSPATLRDGRPGSSYTVFIMTGSPAGITTTLTCPRSVVKGLSRRIGFSSSRGRFVLRDTSELVGLALLAKVVASRSQAAPYLYDLRGSSSLITRNQQQVLRLRCRVGQHCPRGFTHPCHTCAIGYVDCPAATHPATYVRGRCAACNDDAAILDPARGLRCVRCHEG